MSPPPTVYFLALCLICVVLSLAMHNVRSRPWKTSLKETWHLVFTILLLILGLSVIVWVLEAVMIRPIL